MHGARPATQGDLARLSSLIDQAVAATPAARGGHLYGLPARSQSSTERSARAHGDEAQLLLCGTVDEYVVGVAIVSVDAETSTGTVQELYVEPEARSVGVGEALLHASVAWCRQQGCTGIDMPALPGDRETKNLCERAGLTARLLWMHKAL